MSHSRSISCREFLLESLFNTKLANLLIRTALSFPDRSAATDAANKVSSVPNYRSFLADIG